MKAKPKKARRVAGEFTPPPVERGQHDELEVVAHDPNNPGVRRVQIKRPNRLRKYLALKSISEPMCQAGEELGNAWEAAGLVQRTTVNLMGTGGDYRDMSGMQLDAYKQVQRALAGDRKRYADLLVAVCCFDEGVMDTRRLRRALMRLAVHFGMLKAYKKA